VEVWEEKKCSGHMSLQLSSSIPFSSYSTLKRVFHSTCTITQLIETRRKSFLIHLENTMTKKKTHLFTLIMFNHQNVHFICSHHHYIKLWLMLVLCFYQDKEP